MKPTDEERTNAHAFLDRWYNEMAPELRTLSFISLGERVLTPDNVVKEINDRTELGERLISLLSEISR